MQKVTTIGLDIAKSVFQVHGVDAEGNALIRRQLKRRYVLAFFQKLSPCLVGIEACATSHHWSRELKALGHTVRLMPPAYVKPYVKRQKNDATDAEAICEAVTRANMRFVETKTPEQQSCLMLHRTRQLFIRQQRSEAAKYAFDPERTSALISILALTDPGPECWGFSFAASACRSAEPRLSSQDHRIAAVPIRTQRTKDHAPVGDYFCCDDAHSPRRSVGI
jgi:hypothetical protein